ncbi:Hypothetical protein R9X50_00127300 [Acrodontium crateriforme]|uniref:Uncharacterized protein n=1 Tax=Acrodontium crateriforme TaxID=150365 RepID=A0AAQ3R9Y4_9PEZI|nr:Hypothetical protein R9X50_00127300 [Acrodontium crateriforme]
MSDGRGTHHGSSSRKPQLVIVNQTGITSDASRRIVRAQAARASAAQSRVTRQRNREEREGTTTSGRAQSPTTSEPVTTPPPQFPATSQPWREAGSAFDLSQRPLVSWLTSLLNLNVNSVLDGTAIFSSPKLAVGAVTSTLGAVGSLPFGLAPGLFQQATGSDNAGLKLPVRLPRGFTGLQKRIEISPTMLDVLGRTACIDFDSAGLELRLHKLLFDIVITSAGTALSPVPSLGHPIQGHLRVACTCLTIFQGQRANDAIFASDIKYKHGLDAAWSEVTLLDQTPLIDMKSAEASLWAMFIITVTTGATAQFFSDQIIHLFRDLKLTMWEQVRSVLLAFIYPASFLDEPCKSFYQTICSGMLLSPT